MKEIFFEQLFGYSEVKNDRAPDPVRFPISRSQFTTDLKNLFFEFNDDSIENQSQQSFFEKHPLSEKITKIKSTKEEHTLKFISIESDYRMIQETLTHFLFLPCLNQNFQKTNYFAQVFSKDSFLNSFGNCLKTQNRKFKTYFSQLTKNFQDCSTEIDVIRKTLNRLHSQTNFTKKLEILSDNPSQHWKDYNSLNNTLISNNFHFQVNSISNCGSCKKEHISFDVFSFLDCSFSKEKDLSKIISSPLNNQLCECNNQKKKISFFFESLPNALIIVAPPTLEDIPTNLTLHSKDYIYSYDLFSLYDKGNSFFISNFFLIFSFNFFFFL